jgi:4-hydroxybenzoate polyprenyltransferase
MKHWLKSLRLPIVLFASFLVIISFQLVHHLDRAPLPTIVVTVIACATMVQNDWRDRTHDRKKGKLLASDRPNHFFLWTLMLWLIAIAIVVYGSSSNPRFGILPILAIVAGMVYSETRHITLLPLLFAALISAAPILFPIFLGFSSPLLVWLFVATATIILSREIIKDIDDVIIDRGYKKTLPLLVGVGIA